MTSTPEFGLSQSQNASWDLPGSQSQLSQTNAPGDSSFDSDIGLSMEDVQTYVDTAVEELAVPLLSAPSASGMLQSFGGMSSHEIAQLLLNEYPTASSTRSTMPPGPSDPAAGAPRELMTVEAVELLSSDGGPAGTATAPADEEPEEDFADIDEAKSYAEAVSREILDEILDELNHEFEHLLPGKALDGSEKERLTKVFIYPEVWEAMQKAA
jgi:hypothetical protein